MGFIISKHAESQMKLRGIEEKTVLEILDYPDQVKSDNDKTVYQSVIIENGKQYWIKIFVNHLKTPNLVITVYKTSKIGKYL